MEKSFWTKLEKPILGLAPMDGVTYAPFRFMVAKYGKPSVIFTEFTSVEGICAGAIRPLEAFIYDEIERPIVAQLFGKTPECFYKAFFVVAELGFDGIDINMGCPTKNVAAKGSGAGLIGTPGLAKKIIKFTKEAAKDWADGKKIENVGLREDILKYVNANRPKKLQRTLLPVSVKTRTGLNSNIAEDWIKQLLEEQPAAISIHGRTLKQMYGDEADWETIASAAKIIRETDTLVLGNGDIKSLEQAKIHAKKYGVDGILIGRASFGNPWIFNPGPEKNLQKIFTTSIEHSRLHEKILPKKPFLHMRKHLAWYCKGFPGAGKIRQQLMTTQNSGDVTAILNNIK